MRDRVVIIGAGIGGLSAGLLLAAQGVEVSIWERAPVPGGKIRTASVGPASIDCGPTVLTMRDVFEALFADAGSRLEDHLTLTPLAVLARHAWSDGSRLDLFADPLRTADAIGSFAGSAAAAAAYRTFCDETERVFRALEHSFIAATRPSPLGLAWRAGLAGLAALRAAPPHASLWDALGRHFADARLRQLFARYSTYVGSSPFACPATLMLIAHVERAGVWSVAGGMQSIARAIAGLAAARGARFEFGAHVAEIEIAGGRVLGIVLADGTRVPADAVICNADAAALAAGAFGTAARRAARPRPPSARSLSAVTWAGLARCSGFGMDRHNVFFGDDYAEEFDALFARGTFPRSPTVYVCAQDRGGGSPVAGDERVLCLVNAPSTGDTHVFSDAEVEECRKRSIDQLARCGLTLDMPPAATETTTPAAFERLFPATGGALYGAATHGWAASFRRPSATTPVEGLFLAGGSVHPGAGVPMAALSGRLASQAVLRHLASTGRSLRAATLGGTSTRSPTMATTR
jgi:1-hydroxycarotenoid 3,4-desaturase